MRGKNKCKILKEIRQKIADENDIPFVTQECTFQGECRGTCPKCEAELRYLEEQLEKRKRLGKTVTVAALSASLMMGMTACPSEVKEGELPLRAEQFSQESSDPYDTLVLGTIATSEAETVPFSVDPNWDGVTMGMIPVPNSTEDVLIELEGDVAYVEPMTDPEFAGAPTHGAYFTENTETVGDEPNE